MNKGTEELIASMKAAAEKANTDAEHNDWGYDTDAFHDVATPENIITLIAALELKEEQRANWFQIAQMLGEEMDAAEKRIAELEASKLSVKLPEGFIWGADDTDGWLRKSDVIAVIQAAGGTV